MKKLLLLFIPLMFFFGCEEDESPDYSSYPDLILGTWGRTNLILETISGYIDPIYGNEVVTETELDTWTYECGDSIADCPTLIFQYNGVYSWLFMGSGEYNINDNSLIMNTIVFGGFIMITSELLLGVGSDDIDNYLITELNNNNLSYNGVGYVEETLNGTLYFTTHNVSVEYIKL